MCRQVVDEVREVSEVIPALCSVREVGGLARGGDCRGATKSAQRSLYCIYVACAGFGEKGSQRVPLVRPAVTDMCGD
jgi:pantothenate synthetase